MWYGLDWYDMGHACFTARWGRFWLRRPKSNLSNHPPSHALHLNSRPGSAGEVSAMHTVPSVGSPVSVPSMCTVCPVYAQYVHSAWTLCPVCSHCAQYGRWVWQYGRWAPCQGWQSVVHREHLKPGIWALHPTSRRQCCPSLWIPAAYIYCPNVNTSCCQHCNHPSASVISIHSSKPKYIHLNISSVDLILCWW